MDFAVEVTDTASRASGHDRSRPYQLPLAPPPPDEPPPKSLDEDESLLLDEALLVVPPTTQPSSRVTGVESARTARAQDSEPPLRYPNTIARKSSGSSAARDSGDAMPASSSGMAVKSPPAISTLMVLVRSPRPAAIPPSPTKRLKNGTITNDQRDAGASVSRRGWCHRHHFAADHARDAVEPPSDSPGHVALLEFGDDHDPDDLAREAVGRAPLQPVARLDADLSLAGAASSSTPCPAPCADAPLREQRFRVLLDRHPIEGGHGHDRRLCGGSRSTLRRKSWS